MNEHYKDKYIKYKNKYYNFKNKNKKKLEGGNIFIYGGISIIIILISSIFYIEKLRIDESKKKLTLEQSSEQVTVSEPVTESITQQVTEPVYEQVTESITEQVTEPITPLVNDSNSLSPPIKNQSVNDLYNIKSLDLASISLNDEFNTKPQEEPIQAQSQKTYSTMYFTTTGLNENKKEKEAVAPSENPQNIDNVESTQNNTFIPSGLSNSETKPQTPVVAAKARLHAPPELPLMSAPPAEPTAEPEKEKTPDFKVGDGKPGNPLSIRA